MKSRLLGAVCVSLLCCTANAAIVIRDGYSTDTNTGLDWLHFGATNNQSYNQVLDMVAVGGPLEGWRYATTSEVSGLIAQARQDGGTGFGLLEALGSYLNEPVGNYQFSDVYGIHDKDVPSTFPTTTQVIYFEYYLQQYDWVSVQIEKGDIGPDTPSTAMSSFMVRSTVSSPLAIDIEKLTNGSQADDANVGVPWIAQGEMVTWTYQVTNTGELDLSEAELVVTDSQPGITPVLDNASDTGDDLVLSPGETWIYTATAQALDLSDPPEGVKVVTGCGDGRNTYENTGRVEVLGTDVFDEDLSHYCNPGGANIDIRKQDEGPDTRTVVTGSDVIFEIHVTNSGFIDLNSVVVTDTAAPQCDNAIGFLGVGASTTYTCTVPNVATSFTNEACVAGDTPAGLTFSDCDPSTVEIIAANQPPDCSAAVASIDTIWPAKNQNFVAVGVLGVTDPDGDPVSITINSIFQDEPVASDKKGRFVPDGGGIGTSVAQVRAERVKGKNANGRVYHIGFTAVDDQGGACSDEVTVGVPVNRKAVPVDDGALYDSTVTP